MLARSRNPGDGGRRRQFPKRGKSPWRSPRKLGGTLLFGFAMGLIRVRTRRRLSSSCPNIRARWWRGRWVVGISTGGWCQKTVSSFGSTKGKWNSYHRIVAARQNKRPSAFGTQSAFVRDVSLSFRNLQNWSLCHVARPSRTVVRRRRVVVVVPALRRWRSRCHRPVLRAEIRWRLTYLTAATYRGGPARRLAGLCRVTITFAIRPSVLAPYRRCLAIQVPTARCG